MNPNIAVIVSFVVPLFAGCTWWDPLDVCWKDENGKNKRPAEFTVNANGEKDGLQRVSTAWAGGVLPNGEAIVAYESAVRGRGLMEHQEIRLARITKNKKEPTRCTIGNAKDQTVGEIDSDSSVQQILESAVLVPASSSDGDGIVVWVRSTGTSQVLEGRFLDGTGCIGLDPNPETEYLRQPFSIVTQESGSLISLLRAIDMGVRKIHDDFAIFWGEAPDGLSSTVRTYKARLLQWQTSDDMIYKKTALPVDEQGASILDLGLEEENLPAALVPIRISAGRVALLIFTIQKGTIGIAGSVWLTTVDETLRRLGSTRLIAGPFLVGDVVFGPFLNGVYDGRHLLAIWMQLEGDSHTRAYGCVVDKNGNPVGRDDSPKGDAFRLGTASEVYDSQLAATSLPGGGFLVAWRESGRSDDSGLSAAEVRIRSLKTDGTPRFNNGACDHCDFILNTSRVGDQNKPTLMTDGKKQIFAVWSDKGENSQDQDGCVRGIVTSTENLFPDAAKDAETSAISAGAPGYAPCKDDSECRSGAKCVDEASFLGFPGGICYQECYHGDPNSCHADELCLSNPAEMGLCVAKCSSTSDCPSARVCTDDIGCQPLCTQDEDCDSGQCNLYSGLCYTGTLPDLAGLNAPCQSDEDCLSDDCSNLSFTCLTPCNMSRPNCPEGGVCESAGGDWGLCYKK